MLQRFIRLSAINIASNLMVPLAGLVDVAFLGHLSDVRYLAGVALAAVLFNYIYWSFGFLRMSTTGLTAQASGRGDRDQVLLIAVRHLLVALSIGFAILLLQVPLREAGFALLTASATVEESGRQFFDALVWGAPATLANYVLVGWFLGREQGSRVLVITATLAFANIALDYLFIVQWHWQSAGAGAATAFSQYLAVAIGLTYLCTEVKIANLARVAGRILDAVELKALFNLNRDLLVRTFALGTAFSVFINLGAALGTAVLAANAIMLQVVTLVAYFVDGIAFATESLAGYSKGEGDSRVLGKLLLQAGSFALTFALAFALAFALLPASLFGLLTDRPELVAHLSRQVLWLFPVLGFGAVAWMLDGYFIGLTEGKILITSAVFAVLVGFAPLAWIAWAMHSESLLWLALTGFMLGRALPLALAVPATLKPGARPLTVS